MWDQLLEKFIQHLNDDIKIKDKLMILVVLGLAVKGRPTNVEMKQVSKIIKLNLLCTGWPKSGDTNVQAYSSEICSPFRYILGKHDATVNHSRIQ